MANESISGLSIIGRETTTSQTTSFRAENPVSRKALPGDFFEATPRDIDRAATTAERSFASFRRSTGRKRAELLDAIAEEIEALGDTLLDRCRLETALPRDRLQGERNRTCGQLRLFADVLREGSWTGARIDRAQSDRRPVPRPDLRQMQQPLGPVAIFGASNFPLAFSVAGGDTVSALAAGCPVVVKGHPAHPGTSELVARAIGRAVLACDLPPGIFSLLQGETHQTGQLLVRHPAIRAVAFTGSFGGGKALFDIANRRPVPIPVFAEMGSTNPLFLLPGALRSRSADLARAYAASVSLGGGQFCTCPGLAVGLASPQWEAFERQASAAFAEIPAANMLTHDIRQSYERAVAQLSDSGSVQLLSQSNGETKGANARLFATSGAELLAHPELGEEVFGPASLLVAADHKAELLEVARQLEGHLTATVHADDADIEAYGELFTILEQKVGRLILNGFPTGVEVAPAMTHGGPFPATTQPHTTSVGTLAILRFTRPVTYQDFPSQLLPEALHDENPLDIWRLIDGEWTKSAA